MFAIFLLLAVASADWGLQKQNTLQEYFYRLTTVNKCFKHKVYNSNMQSKSYKFKHVSGNDFNIEQYNSDDCSGDHSSGKHDIGEHITAIPQNHIAYMKTAHGNQCNEVDGAVYTYLYMDGCYFDATEKSYYKMAIKYTKNIEKEWYKDNQCKQLVEGKSSTYVATCGQCNNLNGIEIKPYCTKYTGESGSALMSILFIAFIIMLVF